MFRTPTAEGDHCKYAVEYARFGVKVYSNQDVSEKKKFPYGMNIVLKENKTHRIGNFSVVPFANHHDVPIYGYLIHHPEMGTFLFSTDSYKIPITFKGVNHYLIEANYSDAILKENVWSGKVDKKQADRIMLSHMSLDYCLEYLKDSKAEESARTITLCHLSERNSDPDSFRNAVASAFGVPTYIARRKFIVPLDKTLI